LQPASFPYAPALIASDGKTPRGTHHRSCGREALHLVSAFATRERLVLVHEAVGEGGGEQETILALLAKLAAAGSLQGALVTVDAIACNPKVAAAIVDGGAGYLLAVKANQPGLMGENERFFEYPRTRRAHFQAADKGHGRVEERHLAVSTQVDWLMGERRFPGEYRLPQIAAVVIAETVIHQ